ncbi:MAG: DUF3168 domain-containing protein [Acidobacteria bacterium]|nr:DUF3168 domain-containing protein [Acidobacteriota bacterium]
MSDFKSSLRLRLIASGALYALVGDRIYRQLLPPGVTLPAVSYNVVSDIGEQAYTGPVGLRAARVQFSAWAETPEVADELGRIIRQTLDGFHGALGSVSFGGIHHVNTVDLHDAEAQLYHVAVDFRVMYQE